MHGGNLFAAWRRPAASIRETHRTDAALTAGYGIA
jgi:hypothetical protein